MSSLKIRDAGGRLVGYARVSREEQGTDAQIDELRAAGCETIHEEHASGTDRGRPVLAQLLFDISPGDTLVVVRLDRLARSVNHLLQVIEQIEQKGAYFALSGTPIDTTTPQGMFSLQIFGAVAQFERALISERTKAGLRFLAFYTRSFRTDAEAFDTVKMGWKVQVSSKHGRGAVAVSAAPHL